MAKDLSTRVIAVIQVRMGSRRLPGKALLPLRGKCALEWIYKRLKSSRELDGIVMATTVAPKDDILIRRAEKMGLAWYRGQEADLIARLLGAARAQKAKAIVRVTADCPFVDPGLVNHMISQYRAHSDTVDFVTNVYPPSYPDGLDLDILPRKTLERMDREVRDPLHREWLTTYILEHPKTFRILNVSSKKDLKDYRWTLDYPEDLVFVRKVFAHFVRKNQVLFGYQDILELLRRRPDLQQINAKRIDKTIVKGIRSHAYHRLAQKRRLLRSSAS